MQRRAIRSPIVRGDSKDKRVFALFCHVDDDVEVPAIIEDARVDQLELGIAAAAPAVLFQQPRVGKLALRILVEHALIGVAGDGIEVEVALLDVLAVIPLRRNDAEVALFQDRVALVPEGEREAQPLLIVADAGDPVFSPSVRPAPRNVVAERVPGSAAGAVILTNRAPLALTQIRSPRLPASGRGLVQASLFVHDMPLLQGGTMTVVGCRRVSDVTRNSKTGSASNG